MDWKSEEGQALLIRAFPDEITCWCPPFPDPHIHAKWGWLLAYLERELLKHPDMRGWPIAANETITGRSLCMAEEEAGNENPMPSWQLCVHTDFGHSYDHTWRNKQIIREGRDGSRLAPTFWIDTDDAAEALVWMLIMLNESGATGP